MVLRVLSEGMVDFRYLVFVIGMAIGLVGYISSYMFKSKKVRIWVQVTSSILGVLMFVSMCGSVLFENNLRQMEKLNVETYIETKTMDISSRIEGANSVSELVGVTKELYDAEYLVVEKRDELGQSTSSVGYLLVNGSEETVSQLYEGLSKEERAELLNTGGESLESFTSLEFAKLNDDIKSKALELDEEDSQFFTNYIGIKKGILELKVDRLGLEPFSKKIVIAFGSLINTIFNTIVINTVYIFISLLATVLLFLMLRDEFGVNLFFTKEELGFKSTLETDIKESSVSKESCTYGYDLEDESGTVTEYKPDSGVKIHNLNNKSVNDGLKGTEECVGKEKGDNKSSK